MFSFFLVVFCYKLSFGERTLIAFVPHNMSEYYSSSLLFMVFINSKSFFILFITTLLFSSNIIDFSLIADEECQEILQQQQKHKNSGRSAEMVYTKTSAVACFNEAIPVMQYICSKLEENKMYYIMI